MKILIAYYSETGNTAKVAQAIYEEMTSREHEVHIREISQISPDNLKGNDLMFLGSPCHDADISLPTKQFLEQIPIPSSLKLGGFLTHASYTPEGGQLERDAYQKWASPSEFSFQQFCDEKGVEFLGYFSCQGAPSPPIEQFIHDTIVTGEDEWAEYVEEVRKHPNDEDFHKARKFAQDILAKCES
jgi:flavodoxin